MKVMARFLLGIAAAFAIPGRVFHPNPALLAKAPSPAPMPPQAYARYTPTGPVRSVPASLRKSSIGPAWPTKDGAYYLARAEAKRERKRAIRLALRERAA